jgi:hypothetical protein
MLMKIFKRNNKIFIEFAKGQKLRIKDKIADLIPQIE